MVDIINATVVNSNQTHADAIHLSKQTVVHTIDIINTKFRAPATWLRHTTNALLNSKCAMRRSTGWDFENSGVKWDHAEAVYGRVDLLGLNRNSILVRVLLYCYEKQKYFSNSATFEIKVPWHATYRL